MSNKHKLPHEWEFSQKETTMNEETCVACHLVFTEDGLCDDCFAELPMNVWVTVGKKEENK